MTDEPISVEQVRDRIDQYPSPERVEITDSSLKVSVDAADLLRIMNYVADDSALDHCPDGTMILEVLNSMNRAAVPVFVSHEELMES